MFILLNLKNYFTRNVNITSGCFTYILLNDSNGTVKVNLRQRMSGNISNIKIKFLKWKLLGIWKMNIVLLHKLSIFINYQIINRDKFQTMSSLTYFKLLNLCSYLWKYWILQKLALLKNQNLVIDRNCHQKPWVEIPQSYQNEYQNHQLEGLNFWKTYMPLVPKKY